MSSIVAFASLIVLLPFIFFSSGSSAADTLNCNARTCEFVARHGMTLTKATEELTIRRQQQWILRTLDGYNDGQQSLFAGLWERNCPNQVFKPYNIKSLNYGQLEIELIKQKVNGYCLEFINAYNPPNGQQRYIAMWTFKNGACDIIEEAHDITGEQYQNLFDFLTARGYRVHWVSAHKDEISNVAKYAAIFKKGIPFNFLSYHGISSQIYQTKFDQAISLGFRLKWVNGFTINGMDRYNALFEQSGGKPFAARHGLISPRYQCAFDNYVYSGYAPKHVTGYGDGTPNIRSKYAALWELDTMSLADLNWIDDKVNALREQYALWENGNINNFVPNFNPPRMAISIGISFFGKTVFSKGYGKASIQDDEDACPRTMYRTASIGKSIAATSILLLNQMGELQLNDKVFGNNGILSSNKPEYDLSNQLKQPAVREIEVSDILGHISRIRRDCCGGSSVSIKDGVVDALQNNNDIMLPSFGFNIGDVGNGYNYSNLAYNVLGQIVQEITGIDFDEFVEENIFEPAGIPINNYWAPRLSRNTLGERRKWREARFYPTEPSQPFVDNTEFFEVYAGAGGWIISVLDMLKFIARVDGHSQVTDILDNIRMDIINTQIANGAYSSGGGWSNSSVGRSHSGSWSSGTRTYMNRLNNGKTGVIMANYNNGAPNPNVKSVINAILNNNSITWPCWNVDKIDDKAIIATTAAFRPNVVAGIDADDVGTTTTATTSRQGTGARVSGHTHYDRIEFNEFDATTTATTTAYGLKRDIGTGARVSGHTHYDRIEYKSASTSTAFVGLEPDEIGFTEFSRSRTTVITQNELRSLNIVYPEAILNAIGDEDDDPAVVDVKVAEILITPETRLNAIIPNVQFDICPNNDVNAGLCDLDLMQCPDGSFVGRNYEHQCRFDQCPDAEDIKCPNDKLKCSDGSTVGRNPDDNCSFFECPPCDDTQRQKRRLLLKV